LGIVSAVAGADWQAPATAARGEGLYPFLIEGLNVQGRLVRLGPAIDAIVARHDYPPPVATLLGETVTLAAILAGSIKYDGVFTLQAQGDGPVRLVVADVTAEGHLRGYASVDERKYAALSEKSPSNPVPRLLGAGYLAFTVDQGSNTERYQGIVELTGPTLAACAQHYFRQSEQIDSVIHLAFERRGGGWRAGGIAIQRLPRGRAERETAWSLENLADEEREDGWRRVAALVGTVKEAELADPAVPPDRLLFRLFHEDGVRLYRRRPLDDRCRCSRERAAATLRMLPRAELDGLKIDGRVVVTCQFCNRHERFDDGHLDALFAEA
jgi:molecular chaperone Hsp33